jgi:hypothetical protein
LDVLVVFESCFSNTERIGEAVAAGLKGQGAVVTVLEASERAWPLEGVDLLVAGAPVHHRGLPNRLSRALAATQGATPKSFGLAEWLEGMPQWEGGQAATFDCATGNRFIHGSALPPIARRLQRRGVPVVSDARFLVGVMDGPVLPEHLGQARQWGSELAAQGGKTGETAQFWLPSSQKAVNQRGPI